RARARVPIVRRSEGARGLRPGSWFSWSFLPVHPRSFSGPCSGSRSRRLSRRLAARDDGAVERIHGAIHEVAPDPDERVAVSHVDVAHVLHADSGALLKREIEIARLRAVLATHADEELRCRRAGGTFRVLFRFRVGRGRAVDGGRSFLRPWTHGALAGGNV